MTLLLDGVATEGLLGVELVVGAAKDAEVRGGVVAAESVRVDVIELEECSGAAAAAVGRDVGAAKAVAFEDVAANGVGDAAGRSVGARRARAWAFCAREAFGLEICEEQVQGAVDDDGEVTARIRVAHEVAAEVELFDEVTAGCQLEAEAVRRKWLDARRAEPRRRVRPRKACGEQHFDLSLGFVGGGVQELDVVCLRQMLS